MAKTLISSFEGQNKDIPTAIICQPLKFPLIVVRWSGFNFSLFI